MNEGQESIGRIEVAPEVLVTIARIAVQSIEGVQQMAQVPADYARLFSAACARTAFCWICRKTRCVSTSML